MSADAPTSTPPTSGRVLPAFAFIGWRWISRNPASAIAPILLPFMFLYFLRLISPPEYFPLEVVGAMLFTTQNIGSWVLGDSATWRIEMRLQEIFVASPMGRVRYLIGVAFSNLIPAMPALLVLGVLLATLVHVPLLGWAALVAAIGMLWVLFSAIGISLSSRLKSQREVWPVGNLTFTVIGMLSPLYYPITKLPPLWQDAARFLPPTYAAFLVQ
ncbi:MAG: ABC transporter permease, partial [Thermoplasmata archaeon]|nr:ABC transporter permease [Thermoplasmata archaeon]